VACVGELEVVVERDEIIVTKPRTGFRVAAESLQTKLQTNCAARPGTDRHKPELSKCKWQTRAHA
jgi:hypothetical protein